MRPGPPRGDSATVELTVTDDLAAAAAPGLPAACTAAAVLDAGERACQRLVAPHLESGELVVIVKQDLTMRSPIPVGTTAELTVTVALCTPTSVTYEVLARQGGTMVVRGSLQHRVVDTTTYAEEIRARQPATTS